MNLFKKKKEEIDKTASAILYPDKIIIETQNKSGGGSYYITDNVTILPLDTPEKEIGLLAKKHLNDSVFHPVSFDDLKKIRSNHKKKVKIKTEKALFENAKCVAIKFDGENISLNSYQTKTVDKMFLGNPSSIVTLGVNINNEELGNAIRLAWEKCLFI